MNGWSTISIYIFFFGGGGGRGDRGGRVLSVQAGRYLQKTN